MCPPGVDQTMRSAQRWQLLVPELRQVEKVNIETRGHIRGLTAALLSRKPLWDAWSKLARPVLPSSASYTRLHLPLSPPSTLDILSTELLDMILSFLVLSPTDLLAFALTSERFWAIANRHIHQQYLRSCAPWAGAKLALQGSYSMDLPAPFKENGLSTSIQGGKWGGNKCAARRFFWNCDIETPVTSKDLERDYLEVMKSFKYGSGIPETRWEGMESELACDSFFPHDRAWVLRNLTTKEIVTTEKVFTQPQSWKSSWIPADHPMNFKLEDMLLMRICWTSIPSGVDEKLGVHRGVWAGHAFEILCKDEHEKEGGRWKDVTSEVEHDARRLRDKVRSLLPDEEFLV